MADCVYPPPLNPGDTVAIVAPSHGLGGDALDRGVDRLRSFDLEVKVFETARQETEWLRDNPDARARDVNQAFADDDVDGVIAAKGGNREVQILDGVEETTLRDSPKRFFGSSDNTHLHLLLNRLGVVSFYGGQLFPDLVADPEVHPYTRKFVRNAQRKTPLGTVKPAGEWTDEYYDLETGNPRQWFPADGWEWHVPDERVVQGSVVGGCFSMLESQTMLDAGVFPKLVDPGDVLAVETSGEVPEHAEVERFLTVLGERGVLDDLGALLVGKPETPKRNLENRERYRAAQRETVQRVVEEYNDVPVVFDLDFGHTAPVLPLPLGAPVEIDTANRTVCFPEKPTD